MNTNAAWVSARPGEVELDEWDPCANHGLGQYCGRHRLSADGATGLRAGVCGETGDLCGDLGDSQRRVRRLGQRTSEPPTVPRLVPTPEDREDLRVRGHVAVRELQRTRAQLGRPVAPLHRHG